MAMNDQKRLNTGWTSTIDVGTNPDPGSVTMLASFGTITV